MTAAIATMTLPTKRSGLLLPMALMLPLVLGACSRHANSTGQTAAPPPASYAEQAVEEAKAKAATDELTQRWNTLSAEVPQIVDKVTARVDLLSKKQQLPEGVDAAAFKTAKEAASTMTQSWHQALGAFANNNMQEAVTAAQTAKDKGSEVMQTLHLATPVS